MMHSTICHNIFCKGKKPALLLVWLFLWQLASDWLGQELLLVSPVRTMETLLQLAQRQEFWHSIGVSLLCCMSAFLLAAVGGRFAGCLGLADSIAGMRFCRYLLIL